MKKKLSFLASSVSFSSRARIVGAGLSALALVACSGGDQPAPKVASNASAPPAAAPATTPAAATPAAAQSGAPLSPSQDPANQRGGKRYEGGIEKLDSKYDLSKVKSDPAAAAVAENDGHDHAATPGDGSSLLPEAQAEINGGRFELAEGMTQVKDLGKLRQGDVAGCDFVFVSNGKAPLVVTGVKPSCGCTKAELELIAEDGTTRKAYTKGDPIPVGSKFVLETEINTDGRQGPFNSQVSLYGNDTRGTFTVRLTAEVEPVLAITPSPTVFFGRITTKDRVEQSVTVTSTRGEPFLLELGQEAVQEPVELKFTAKNPDAQGKSNEWEVHVALGPNTEAGMRHYPINFKSDLAIANPKYPSPDGTPQYTGFMLNVQAQVLGMVSAEPPFLTFGMVKPGEEIERSLRLECHDEFKLTSEIPVIIEGLQGQALPWGDRFKVTVTPIEDGKAADVKVLLTGLPDDVNGSIGGQFRIKVGHPFMDEVAIRFSAVCRPGLPTTPVPTPTPAPAPGGQQK